MFFLLPIIAGAVATAISAGEVALGVTAAVGVGAAVKKSIDTKQANEIMRYSEEKFYNECAKLQNESNETQHKIEKANQIKRELNAGILNNSMHVLNSYRNRNLLDRTRTYKSKKRHYLYNASFKKRVNGWIF